MTSHGGDWDENFNGTRSPDNLSSFPGEGRLHTATVKVWQWRQSGAHAPGRVVVPSVAVEALFRKAPVTDKEKLNNIKVLSRRG